MFSLEKLKMAVIGLGYVGLPVAVAFGSKYETVGFDIDQLRIKELAKGHDRTNEVEDDEFKAASKLSFSGSAEDLADCNFFIVTVPTPIDDFKRPDLRPLYSASATIGAILKPNDIVVYESTVYPGATEQDCVPVLEQGSGLSLNKDFFVGYSPERINPGDKTKRFSDITKITAGSTSDTADFVDLVYRQVVTAGTHKASSIAVAEAAKVIENTQRDVNIALVNELSLICERMGIDTTEVLEAAGTKWNFLPFRPGLVGGHCIGVDPYYLTHQAQRLGHNPEMILAGRRINDSMGQEFAARLVKAMLKRGIELTKSKVLILGLTFKENCPDLRNTLVTSLISELADYAIDVQVADPWASPQEAKDLYDIELMSPRAGDDFDAIILAVAHADFLAQGADAIRSFGHAKTLVFDIKAALEPSEVDLRP